VSEVNQGTKAVVTHTVKIPILGEYNIYNGTAALLATYFRFNVEPSIDQSIKSLNTFNALVGRMQIMNNSPLVIVDFAHTPNALKNALNTVQSITKGKLFVVFGCAGLRDKKKRTMMGEIAAEYADSIYIVPEDPRTESLKSINDEIITGIQLVTDKNFILEANLFRYDIPEVKSRVEGVNAAINRASSEDTVIICGKGHEQSLCFDVKEYPYSDQETVINYLNKYNEVISNSRVTNKG